MILFSKERLGIEVSLWSNPRWRYLKAVLPQSVRGVRCSAVRAAYMDEAPLGVAGLGLEGRVKLAGPGTAVSRRAGLGRA